MPSHFILPSQAVLIHCPGVPLPVAQGLTERLEALLLAETLPEGLESYVGLTNWVREPDSHFEPKTYGSPFAAMEFSPAWQRYDLFLTYLERVPEVNQAVVCKITSFIAQTHSVALFSEAGLPTERGLISEATDRTLGRLLPAPRDDEDLAKLMLQLFHSEKAVRRFADQPPELFERYYRLLTPPELGGIWTPLTIQVEDSLAVLGARIQMLGMSHRMRVRSRSLLPRQSPFYQLPRSSDRLLIRRHSPELISADLSEWRHWLQECRDECRYIETHLENNGVNVAVVFSLEVIQKSLSRMEALMDVLTSVSPRDRSRAIQRLVQMVVLGSMADRSVIRLFKDNSQLLAKKIVERAGAVGEHYIANNRREYWAMWKAAAGGGLLTVLTAAIKLKVTHIGLPALPEGILSGLNYAASFVLMQHLGLALATKQPAMTASALAGIIQKNPGQSRTSELIDYFARIFRTQIAAALGNVIFVGLGALLFSSFWMWLFHNPYLDAHLAEYTLTGLSPISSGTLFYATLTGVILWLGSLTGGWLDNFLAYHRIPRAIVEHPWGARILGQQKLVRLANAITRNISGWGVSISLGFMLGMVPEIGRVTGIPLDVRHVTLNTGMMALATNSLGKLFEWNFFLLAVAGIGVTFILNLSVSFYLALRVALGAFGVPFSGQVDFFKNLFWQFLHRPVRFFFPPAQG